MANIYDGSFVLGDTNNLTFEAGPGITIDSPSAGTVRIGADETVLWSGSAGATSASLSESIFNFSEIAIYGKSNEMTQMTKFYIQPIGSIISLSEWFKVGVGTDWIICSLGLYEISNNGSTLSNVELRHIWFNKDSFAVGGHGTQGINLYKVIGINRISGSNA